MVNANGTITIIIIISDRDGGLGNSGGVGGCGGRGHGRNVGSGGGGDRGQRAIVDSFIVVLIDYLECYKFDPFSIFLSMIDIMNQK